MLNVLNAMLDFFSMIGDFIYNIVSGLANLFLMIPQALGTITNVTAYIPAELAVFSIAGIAICVVFQIIGR